MRNYHKIVLLVLFSLCFKVGVSQTQYTTQDFQNWKLRDYSESISVNSINTDGIRNFKNKLKPSFGVLYDKLNCCDPTIFLSHSPYFGEEGNPYVFIFISLDDSSNYIFGGEILKESGIPSIDIFTVKDSEINLEVLLEKLLDANYVKIRISTRKDGDFEYGYNMSGFKESHSLLSSRIKM